MLDPARVADDLLAVGVGEAAAALVAAGEVALLMVLREAAAGELADGGVGGGRTCELADLLLAGVSLGLPRENSDASTGIPAPSTALTASSASACEGYERHRAAITPP